MVAFEAIDFFEIASGEFSPQSRKQRLFFIGCVPFATHVEILKCSLNGGSLFAGKAPRVPALSNQAQDVEEMLDPAMAIFQHANRIVESAVWFRRSEELTSELQ